jgi:hypothetical protein
MVHFQIFDLKGEPQTSGTLRDCPDLCGDCFILPIRRVKSVLNKAKNVSCINLIAMTNNMQLCRIIYYSIVPWLIYMFRAILSLIIRSILTVITASGFIHTVLLSKLSRN